MDIETPRDHCIISHQKTTLRLPERAVKKQGGVGSGLDKRSSIRPKRQGASDPMHLFFFLPPGIDHSVMREGV
jgi:hypothetical protein